MTIEIADAGPGIPADELSRIFERFARVDESGRAGEARDGFGLGLSIVSAIVEGHGGTVTVRDRGQPLDVGAHEPADDAAAAAKMEMSFMTPGISLSKGRRASPKRCCRS